MNRWFAFGVLGACVLAACSGGSDASEDTVGPTETNVAANSQPADTTPADSEPPTTEAATAFRFDAPTGDYSIVFPGEPTLNDLAVPLPGETITADAYVYEDGLSAAYFTSVFDYPDGLTDPDPLVVLEGARDGAINNVGAELASSENIERDGVPGISFTFLLRASGQDGVGRAVVFFDRPRLYQSFALGDPADDAKFENFVGTFEFTGDASTEDGS